MKLPADQNKTLELFKQGPTILESVLSDLKDDELDYIPFDKGWTIRQIVHHIVDGDDLWKAAIKTALGNEHAEFNLKWYLEFTQKEWASSWSYEMRPIDISLTLFKANRSHLLQLLEYVPNGWNKSIKYQNPDGTIEIVTVGSVIQMQADHVTHHVNRISAIRKEFADSK